MTPLIFWRKELRPDSGGAGRTRGGLGQMIEMESGIGRPFGHTGGVRPHRASAARRDGGSNGARAMSASSRAQKLNGKGFQMVPAGDRLIVLTPGGGGIGAPDKRAAENVARDLADELI